jgi:hypothetical protein
MNMFPRTSRRHACTHTHTHAHTRTHAHTQTRRHTCRHAHMHMHTGSHAHRHRHTGTHAHRRGLELLRVGGLMAYSTCSLNPIEDEVRTCAVHAHALHMHMRCTCTCTCMCMCMCRPSLRRCSCALSAPPRGRWSSRRGRSRSSCRSWCVVPASRTGVSPITRSAPAALAALAAAAAAAAMVTAATMTAIVTAAAWAAMVSFGFAGIRRTSERLRRGALCICMRSAYVLRVHAAHARQCVCAALRAVLCVRCICAVHRMCERTHGVLIHGAFMTQDAPRGADVVAAAYRAEAASRALLAHASPRSGAYAYHAHAM